MNAGMRVPTENVYPLPAAAGDDPARWAALAVHVIPYGVRLEKFTRTGPKTLEYRATVIDPKTWTRPWTMLIAMEKDDNYQILEYACHEGNYAMTDILSGARQAETAKKVSK